MNQVINLRPVNIDDLDELNKLEQQCFDSDRLSKRRLKHWIKATNRIFLVAEDNSGLSGYGLILLHQGTRLARLYSIAIADRARGHGVAKKLLHQLEVDTAGTGRLFMRLEVAKDNHPAIKLYQASGYQAFGTYSDYYEDHQDAVRMQKRIRYIPENLLARPVPWFRQTTDFTCGPASLLMAMASLHPEMAPCQAEELEIWREATTIFMTSGHGGCHPIGLALAAGHRGFKSTVFINKRTPLFVESVRSSHKKSVMALVDSQFRQKAKTDGIKIKHQEITQEQIATSLYHGAAVIILISTYRMDGKKAPHWVTVTGIDDQCLYVNDPDPTEGAQTELDCQHIPIARDDFGKMSAFGSERLRTAVIIEPR